MQAVNTVMYPGLQGIYRGTAICRSELAAFEIRFSISLRLHMYARNRDPGALINLTTF